MNLGFRRVAGIVLLAAGIWLLYRPNIPTHMKKSEVHIGSTRAIVETRRMISVPKTASWVLIACGGLLIVLGGQRR
ncbi:MAG TPA: hypothetical protein VMU43_00405 [Candidatus Acidoferrum sp.]|nr:hypothetical protein [Candidatus Acidoferrum sp.]